MSFISGVRSVSLMQFKKKQNQSLYLTHSYSCEWFPCDSYVDNAAQKNAIHKIQQKENLENFLCLTQIEKTKKNENNTFSLHGQFLLCIKKERSFS